VIRTIRQALRRDGQGETCRGRNLEAIIFYAPPCAVWKTAAAFVALFRLSNACSMRYNQRADAGPLFLPDSIEWKRD
jgi:hypothetical protein